MPLVSLNVRKTGGSAALDNLRYISRCSTKSQNQFHSVTSLFQMRNADREPIALRSAFPQARLARTPWRPGRLRRRRRRRRADLICQRRVSGGQQRDRHAVRRTAHVIQPDLVAEDHRFGVAAVLAADADLQIGARRASVLDADFEKLPHAFLIERLEWVVGEDLLLDVEGQEAARVVAAQSHRGLSKVVRAEAEEFRDLGDAVSGQRGARQFNHRPYQVLDRFTLALKDLARDASDDVGLQLQLVHVGHQRDHDLRFDYDAFTFDLDGGLEDRARLHLGDLGINDAQAAAAMTEHRVEFVQLRDAGLGLLEVQLDLFGQFFERVVVVRDEFVERRVERADRHRIAVHRAEDAGEIFALQFQQRGQRAVIQLARTFDLLLDFFDALFGVGLLIFRGLLKLGLRPVELDFEGLVITRG